MRVESTPQRLPPPKSPPTTVTLPSPFKFLDAYTAQDRGRFFGRETEQKHLVELIFRSRLILVYGQSGTGKTSLVQCGMAQALSDADYFPVLIRRRGDLPTTLQSTLLAALDEASATDPLALVTELTQRSMRPVYLIFDQFEEIFISGTPDEQHRFFAILSDLYRATIPCKLLLVMREEYIAYLYPYENGLPGLFDFRLRLEPMSEKNLYAVIAGTCEQSPHIELREEAQTIGLILENNRGARTAFQLPYLQVYLDRLWKTAPETSVPVGAPAPPDLRDAPVRVVFDPPLVQRVGPIDDVLKRFLGERVAEIAQELEKTNPTDVRADVNRVLEAFVTEEGTRREQRLDALRISTGLEPAFLGQILDALENSRIVRHEENTYELPHDSLAKVIDQGRSTEQRQINDILRRLKEAFAEFRDKGGTDDLLLTPRRLTEIGLFSEAIRTELHRTTPADSEATWQFVNASRDFHQREQREQEERRRRQLRRLVLTMVGVSALLVLAVVAVGVAIRQWRDSNVKSVVFQTREMDPLSALVMTAWAYGENQNPVTENAFFNVFYNRQPYELALDPGSPVAEAKFSADGRFIVTATKDNHLHIWDGTGRQLLDSLDVGTRFGQWKASADFSKMLLITFVGGDSQVLLWNRKTRRLLPLPLPVEFINLARISPDGETILVTTDDHLVWLNGDGQPTELAPIGGVAKLQFSVDGRWVSLVRENGRAYLGDVRTHRLVDSLRLVGRGIQSADFFTGGHRLLVTTRDDGGVFRWDFDRHDRHRTTKLSFGAFGTHLSASDVVLAEADSGRYFLDKNFTVLASSQNDQVDVVNDFSPDGGAIVGFVTASPQEVQVQDRYGRVESRFLHTSEVSDAAFSPDGRRVLTVTFEGQAYLWNRHDPRHVRLAHETDVVSSTPVPGGQAVATGVGNKLIFWDFQGKRIDSVTYPAPLLSCQFSPDGRIAYTTTADGHAQAWRRGSGQAPQQLPFSNFKEIFPSPDGTYLLVTAEWGTVATRPDGSQLTTLPGNPMVRSVDFSPDGQTALGVAYGGKAFFWGFGDQKLRPFPAKKSLEEARFAPDGQHILAGSADGGLEMLTLTGTPTGPTLPRMGLRGLQFSSDGRDVLAEDAARVGYLYNLPRPGLRSMPQRGEVQFKRFSPDGQLVLLLTDASLHLRNRQAELMMATDYRYAYADFSSDGTLLLTQSGKNVLLWPSPNNLVTWLHRTYDARTLSEIRQRAKQQYGIQTSFREAVWQGVKARLGF